MNDLQKFVNIAELQQLAARYWARADGDASQSLADMFPAAGTLRLGSLALDGLAAIERFFTERDATQRAAQRTTRHIACNHLATWLADDRVRIRSTVIVHVGTGPLPLESTVPAGIADFDDLCVLSASGRWLFERREARTIFAGPGAAKFAR